MASYGSETLLTLQDEGRTVPETRVKDARAAQDFARRLIDNDEKRTYKRSRINGLVDGNPPYRASKLREAGRAEACNVNFGQGRSLLETAAGAFYDLFSEASGFITVRTAYGEPEERETWSNVISEESDKTLRDDATWDYEKTLCCDNIILHGTGPLLFEDAFAVLPKAFVAGDLKVPERTKSDTKYWEVCMIQADYWPHELFEYVRDERAATAVGWDVDFTRQVISNAMDIRNQAGVRYEWEFYQQELKNNSLSYYDDSKICRLAHLLWREFDGRITHAIVERDAATGLETKYLYFNHGRYKNFQNVVHPMYFDHGNGGFHHSVTGLGVKMFPAFEYENRLICNLCDKAFSPKILFKPTTAAASQKFTLGHYGDYGILPPGTDAIQNPMAGLMNDGIELHNTLLQLVGSTLSQYQQPLAPEMRGNPVTKFEKQVQVAMQSAISKTKFNRFYAQLDQLYAEIYRRLCNLNTTDQRAKDFQERCFKRGVPKEALQRTEKLQATRVIGQGNAFMRKQSIDSIMMIAGSLPEEGRDNLIMDRIAADAGQSAVNRYYPRKAQPMGTEQQAEAMLQIAGMKIGVPPVITSNQQASIFAALFLKAAQQSLQSLQQRANPMEVLSFLQLAGPAAGAHLQRFANDPTRKELFQALSQQWKQIAQATDQLKQQIQKMAQNQQKQGQKTQRVLSDIELKNVETQADIRRKDIKVAAQLQQSAQRHQQGLALSDAETAAQINNNRLKSLER